MTKISEIMTEKVMTVSKTKPLKEIVKLMANSKISSIIVTDKGRVVGILTERDLLKKVTLDNPNLSKKSLDKVMTPDPMTVNSHSDIGEASQLMHDKNVRHLPVVDNEQLVGLVTQTDIVKEANKIHHKNVTFMTYQNIQTVIIILFFVFFIGYLLYKYYFG